MLYVLDPPIEPVTVYDPPVIFDYVPTEDLFQWIEPTLTPPEPAYDFGGETDPESPSVGYEAELQPDLAYYVEADVDLVVGAPSESLLANPTSPTTCDEAMKTLGFGFFVSTTFCLHEFELAV